MTLEQELRISERMTRIILLGMQEILGGAGLATIADLIKNPHLGEGTLLSEPLEGLRFTEVSSIQQAFEGLYGEQGARGAALRSGRSAFCYFLKEFGDEAGFNQLEFRLTPLKRRVLVGLESLARITSREIGQQIQVQAAGKVWTWQISNCPECWGRQSLTPACDFTVGLLQEFLSWLSGGKVYLVEETACRAKGDPACSIRIDQTPLD